MSQAFRNACRAMGITLQPAHEGSPWEKGTVETSFSAVGTLFAQYVAGYAGSSVERRGKNPDDGAAWSIAELQDLLDEWLVTTWQARPHAGLFHPLMPGRELTPNEMYAALVETAGYVPVPLAASDYVELLPAAWRKVNAYGVKIGNRTYDCKALTPCRRQHSGVNARNGLWEVHFDPHDVTRVWVRDHLGDGGWILAPWTHLRAAPAPFGEQAWDHARKMLARRGQDPVTEAEIARAAAALPGKAEQGPPRGSEERRDRKAAPGPGRQPPPARRCRKEQRSPQASRIRRHGMTAKTTTAPWRRSFPWASSTPARRRRNGGEQPVPGRPTAWQPRPGRRAARAGHDARGLAAVRRYPARQLRAAAGQPVGGPVRPGQAGIRRGTAQLPLRDDHRGDDGCPRGRPAGPAAHPAEPPGDQRPPGPHRVRSADHRQDHRPQAARPHSRADGPRALSLPAGRPDPGRLRDHPAQGLAPQARHGVRPFPRPSPGQAWLQHHRYRRCRLPGHARSPGGPRTSGRTAQPEPRSRRGRGHVGPPQVFHRAPASYFRLCRHRSRAPAVHRRPRKADRRPLRPGQHRRLSLRRRVESAGRHPGNRAAAPPP